MYATVIAHTMRRCLLAENSINLTHIKHRFHMRLGVRTDPVRISPRSYFGTRKLESWAIVW